MVYMQHSFDPFEDSKNYSVFVTKDKLYIAKKWGDDDAYVVVSPMVPGIDLSRVRGCTKTFWPCFMWQASW